MAKSAQLGLGTWLPNSMEGASLISVQALLILDFFRLFSYRFSVLIYTIKIIYLGLYDTLLFYGPQLLLYFSIVCFLIFHSYFIDNTFCLNDLANCSILPPFLQEMPKFRRDAIVGNMLGDGAMSVSVIGGDKRGYGNAFYAMTLGWRQFDYIQFLYNVIYSPYIKAPLRP